MYGPRKGPVIMPKARIRLTCERVSSAVIIMMSSWLVSLGSAGRR